MAPRHRKDLAAARRRVEDEGDEDGLDVADLDDESLSEGSIISDEGELPEGDDNTRVEDAAVSTDPPTANGDAKRPLPGEGAKSSNGISPEPAKPAPNRVSDMDLMLHGLKISEQDASAEGVHYEDLRDDAELQEPSPAVVNSTAQMDQPQEAPYERRRREHEEYKKKRDADPAFVPNRGAFFMHDHRHAGPAANGFRPFGRGRGRGKAGIGGPYAPIKYVPLYPGDGRLSANSITSAMCRSLSNPPMPLGHTTCTK